jgi:moderate conductance mechanosensitive channel
VRLWLISLTGAVAVMASSVARADESAFQRLIGLASADVSANLQALRDDFALAPSEAKRLASDVAVALNDGTAVRVVTFALILVIAGSGLEWLYWTFAAAPLRAVVSTTATLPRQAMGLALHRLAYLGVGVVVFTASTVGAVLILPWPPKVDTIVIAATALVVAVRSAWIIADVVVSPHQPSLRLAALQQYQSGFLVGGVAWLTTLAAAAMLVPQLLTALGSARLRI